MATDIVVAYLGRGGVEANDLPDLVRRIRFALSNDDAVDEPEKRLAAPGLRAIDEHAPRARDAAVGDDADVSANALPVAVQSIEETVTEDHLICLEDGKPYRSLRRHLMAKYGLTPEAYRKKWKLPADYPMVAPSYSRDRADVAKRIGLGKARGQPAAGKRRTRKVAG